MKRFMLIGAGLILAITLFGCLNNGFDPNSLLQLMGHEGAIGVAEAVAGIGDMPPGDIQVVETSVEIYGFVTALGEFFCPCFKLSSDHASMTVRYALFPEEEDYLDVSIDSISNGNWVLVVGTLRKTGQLPPEIWAKEILLIQ